MIHDAISENILGHFLNLSVDFRQRWLGGFFRNSRELQQHSFLMLKRFEKNPEFGNILKEIIDLWVECEYDDMMLKLRFGIKDGE